MVIIDGTNVAYSRKLYGKPMIENIELILELFESQTTVEVLIKASLVHSINDKQKLEDLLKRGVIIQVPPTFNDDKLILKLAQENDDYIVSNDMFRDHKEFPLRWVKDHRIEFVIIGNRVYTSPDFHTLPFVDSRMFQSLTKLPIQEEK